MLKLINQHYATGKDVHFLVCVLLKRFQSQLLPGKHKISSSRIQNIRVKGE